MSQLFADAGAEATPPLLRFGLYLNRLVYDALGMEDGYVLGVRFSCPDPRGIKMHGPLKAGGAGRLND